MTLTQETKRTAAYDAVRYAIRDLTRGVIRRTMIDEAGRDPILGPTLTQQQVLAIEDVMAVVRAYALTAFNHGIAIGAADGEAR